MRRCGIIGRGMDSKLEKKIYDEVEKLIKSGVGEFYSTGSSEFHEFCEKAVIKHGGKVIFVPYTEKIIEKSALSRYSGMICLFNCSDKAYDTIDKWIVKNCDVFLCENGENPVEWDKDKVNGLIN